MTETRRCGAPTPTGTCERKVGAGHRCGFHPDHGVNGVEDSEPLVPATCECEEGLPVADSYGEVACVKCGRSPDPNGVIGDPLMAALLSKRARDAALARLLIAGQQMAMEREADQ